MLVPIRGDQLGDQCTSEHLTRKRKPVENLKQKGFDVRIDYTGMEEPRGQPGGSEESRDREDRKPTVPQS